MKTRSIFKRLAALAVALALTLSIGGVALAGPGDGGGNHGSEGGHGGPGGKDYITVIFDPAGGSINPAQIQVEVKDGPSGTKYISFELPGKDDCTRSGFELYRWKIGGDAFNPGATFTKNVRKNDGPFTFVAQWAAVEKCYTLHYSITPAVAGQPGNPPDEHSSSPIVPTAAVFMADHYFSGWSSPEWQLTGEQLVEENGEARIVRSYEATVTGCLSRMEVKTRTTYTLIFQNKQPGVTFWPDDIIGSETKPGLPGDPVLPGYRFIGWDPGTLNWDKAKATVTSKLVIPNAGSPYILVTTNLSLAIAAVFEGIPTTVTPVQPPQTGGAGYLGCASLLLGLSAGLAGFALMRGRRKN